MKKILLLLAAAGMLVASSCCNKSDGTCDKSKTECAADTVKKACCEKWAKFDSLTVEDQTVLLAQRKEALDSCQAKTKAKLEAVALKFAKYDSLDIAGKKQLFDELDACKKKCDEGKKCCKKDADKKDCKKDCKKDEAKQCDKK